MIARFSRPVLRAAGQAVDAIAAMQSALFEPIPASLDSIGRPILLVSHRRSGTHLVMDTIRRNCPACVPRMVFLENLHSSYLHLARFEPSTKFPADQREARRILAKSRRPLMTSHATPGFPDLAPNHAEFVAHLVARAAVVHVVRHPAHVMCSLWTYTKGFRRSTPSTIGEFMREEDAMGRSRIAAWAAHYRAWRESPSLVRITFEDLVHDPSAELRRLADACDIETAMREPIVPKPLRNSRQMWHARLRRSVESTNYHMRGLRPSTPAEVFTEEDWSLMKRDAGDVMAELGYDPER